MPDSKPKTSIFNVVALCATAVILFALLLPAIESNRPNRTARCENNLRQLSLAWSNFDTQRGNFPGYVQQFGVFRPGDTPTVPFDPDADVSDLVAHEKVGTWAVALLPYLEEQALYELWATNKYPIAFGGSERNPLTEGRSGRGYNSVAVRTVSVFQCPESLDRRDERGHNSYACNAGMFAPVSSPTFEQSMSAANGIFNNKFPGIGLDGLPVPTGAANGMEEIVDGRSATLLFTENLQAMPWHRAGFIDARDLVIKDGQEHVAYEPTCRYTQGVVWHLESDDPSSGLPAINPIHRINSTVDGTRLSDLRMTESNAADLARPSSLHPDGVYVAMADGSVKFINDSIDYRVYQSILAPNDSESDIDFGDWILTNELE